MKAVLQNTFGKYPAYKDSGAKWIGQIPSNWSKTSLGALLMPVSKKNRATEQLLSITREKGVIVRDTENEDENHNFIPDDLSGYKLLERGQFGMNKMKAWQGSYGVSEYTGIVSPAYYIFRFTKEIDPRFFHLAIRSKRYIAFFGQASDGVRIGQWDLSKDRMKKIPFVYPSLQEQTAIANFLDEKTEKIDRAIAQKERMIELLKERKQIMIQEAVTKGLDPDVKMKDSGIDWIGMIPEHWEVKRLKYTSNIFRGKFTHRPRNDERLYDGDYPFFQTGDIARSGKFLSKYRQTLNELGLRVSTLIPKGTIVVTIAANIGDVAILDIDACFPDSIVGFKPMTFMVRDYMFYSLIALKQQLISSTTKNTQMNLNVERVGNNFIVFPSPGEQDEILRYIENQSSKIDNSIRLQEKQIEQLKEYKSVLIDSAVTGKIKVC